MPEPEAEAASENGDEPDGDTPARKKTRRGSRGGRRRRKPAGTTAATTETAPQTRASTSLSEETRGPSQPIVPSCSHSSYGARISTGVMPASAAPCSSR